MNKAQQQLQHFHAAVAAAAMYSPFSFPAFLHPNGGSDLLQRPPPNLPLLPNFTSLSMPPSTPLSLSIPQSTNSTLIADNYLHTNNNNVNVNSNNINNINSKCSNNNINNGNNNISSNNNNNIIQSLMLADQLNVQRMLSTYAGTNPFFMLQNKNNIINNNNNKIISDENDVTDNVFNEDLTVENSLKNVENNFKQQQQQQLPHIFATSL
ncbi:hypothetical protein HELRODRAFT_169690 [Helobdella robusta]|uniref:Uncharacterized protein n=1 Tax=Helobdella robusta TaxID=6412 RepID=T1F284_HELRO|nr:hypothetical protein HELRODRAFT_169690 [Helobdella robusta]ESO07973.1 hypothetical protein HELRODRAFT_169690 [Helobdella robusta]